MAISNPLLTNLKPGQYSAWDAAANCEKEERPMRSVNKIVVKGPI